MILMKKSPHKTISLLLAIVLLVPANAGAATWMALSMSAMNTMESVDHSTDSVMTDHGMHHSQHADHQSHQHGERQHGGDQHGGEDCNDHCVSCANHCSSMAIPFDNFMLSDLSKQSQRFEPGNLNSFSDLLFRPPIHA